MKQDCDVEFYLASQSPQRIRLLREAGYTFSLVDHGGAEPPPQGDPWEYVRLAARAKALGGAKKVPEGALVVGADTVVVLDGQILGKPSSRREAFTMIQRLQGTIHSVLSAVAFVRAPEEVVAEEVVESLVEMDALSPEEIESYLDSVDHLEKAGACDIESISFARVVKGSFSNVVGMPLERFRELIQQVKKETPYGC